MRFPSKNTSLSSSIISKFPVVLNALEHEDMTASELYKVVCSVTDDIGEFVEILDCLFALGKLELDAEMRLIHYVG